MCVRVRARVCVRVRSRGSRVFFFNKISCSRMVAQHQRVFGRSSHRLENKINRKGGEERGREREKDGCGCQTWGCVFVGVCVFLCVQACVVYNFVQSRWVGVCLCEGAHEHV